MRNFIKLLFMLVVLSGCSDNKMDKDLIVIPVDMTNACSDISSFVEKVEIIPLETNDSSQLKGYSKMLYDANKEMYAIMDNRHYVYLFDKNGSFVSSSEKQYGPGPEQYQIIVDMKFNHFNGLIELFSPYGTIYYYDMNFNYKGSKRLKNNDLIYSHFISYGCQQSLLAPSVQFNNTLCWADFQKGERLKTVEYSGTLSSLSMNREVFYRIDNDYYFIPSGVDYMFYRISMDNQTLIPYMKLDFGKEEIEEDDLPGIPKMKYTKSEKKSRDLHSKMWNRISFLQNSSYTIPIIKLFDKKYVYVYCLKEGKRSSYIYNMETKNACNITNETSLKMPFCFSINDNVLYSIVESYEIERYINGNYMSEATLNKIRNLNEEDNPVIIKYYLR